MAHLLKYKTSITQGQLPSWQKLKAQQRLNQAQFPFNNFVFIYDFMGGWDGCEGWGMKLNIEGSIWDFQ